MSRLKVRVLVSGFQAFGGDAVNPTERLMDALTRQQLEGLDSIDLRAVVLPVEFGRGFEVLRAAIQAFNPDVVLSFGQAGGRSRIEFERVAINLQDAEIPDNAGSVPRSVAIDEAGDLAFFSTLPLTSLVDALKAVEIPAGISNTAGLFVCNDLFYRLQSFFRAQPSVRSGFIHVPYLPEQANVKAASGNPVPSMAFETMKRALEVVLLEISKIPFSHR